MKKTGKINERLTVGGQPTEDEVRKLQAEGFEAIINLRRDGEANQPLDPAGEGKTAAAAGLKYSIFRSIRPTRNANRSRPSGPR